MVLALPLQGEQYGRNICQYLVPESCAFRLAVKDSRPVLDTAITERERCGVVFDILRGQGVRFFILFRKI